MKGVCHGVIEKKLTLNFLFVGVGCATTTLAVLIFKNVLVSTGLFSSASEQHFYKIELVNKCFVPDWYFAIELMGQEKQIVFNSGTAEFFADRDSKLRLVISEPYSDFAYSDNFKDIASTSFLIADCGPDNSLKQVFDSLNNAFR